VVELKGRPCRTPFALKSMRKADVVRKRQQEHVRSEISLLGRISHPFIVHLYAAFHDDSRLFLLMEFVNGGELFSCLKEEGTLPVRRARFYAAELTLALAYLHSQHVAYRDLKPENVLIDSEGHVKIADFGFARVIVCPDRAHSRVGTPEYQAPEIVQARGHGTAVDWWALGVLLFEMLVGISPFFDEYPCLIFRKVLEGHVHFPPSVGARARDLVRQFLTVQPELRLGNRPAGAEDVMNHKWFAHIPWARLPVRGARPPHRPGVTSAGDASMFDEFSESDDEVPPTVSAADQQSFEDFRLGVNVFRRGVTP
jgi:serine/threonine protein kinase